MAVLQFNAPFGRWLTLLLAAVAFAAIALSHRYQRLPASRRRRGLLKGLRWTVFGLLVLCLLAPALEEDLRDPRPPHAAIVLDVSRSMSVPDAAPAAEEPASRFERAVQAAATMRDRLEDEFIVHLYTVGDSTTPLTATGALDDLQPTAQRTNILGGLQQIHELRQNERLAGVFLLSDGVHNADNSIELEDLARTYQESDDATSIYPVAFGRSDLPDLELKDLRVNRLVTLNTMLRVTAVVRAQGGVPGAVPVRIWRERDGAEPRVVQERKVNVGGHGSETEVTFEFLPAGTGYQHYRVEVAPRERETITENNSRPFAVSITKRPLRVLYMEGTENRLADRMLWEHQYLEEALKEDGIEITTLLREDREKALEAGVYWVSHPTKGFPRTKEALYQYDVVIISDIPKDKFSKKELQNLVDFVGKFGGGLVMIGGWTAFGPGGWDASVVDKLLPVDMLGKDEGYEENQNFCWQVTEDGFAHPIMRLVDDPEENRRIWEEKLPPFYGFNMVQRAKPAATVLAVHPDRGNLYSDNFVMLAVQQYGRGRSMAFTSDTTYGWGTDFESRFGERDEDTWVNDARYFKRFWQNAIRWLAHYRLNAPNKLAYIELDSNVCAVGDRPQIQVRAMTQEYEPTHDAELELTATTPSGQQQSVTMEKDFSRPGTYTGTLPTDEPGQYDLQLNAFLEGEKLADDQVMLFAREGAVEFHRFAVDTQMLEQLADSTGGQVFAAPDAALACDDLRERGRLAVPDPVVDEVWDHWVLLGLLVGLLGAEWFLRKKAGLA